MIAPAIRPVGLPHLSVLAALHAEAFEDAWSESSIGELMAMSGALALLAELDSEGALGFLLCRQAGSEWEVLTLAVRPAARRRGIGTALVAALCAAAEAAGGEAVILEVALDNDGARLLYDRCGFVEVGRRPAYYARPGARSVDALVLRRALARASA